MSAVLLRAGLDSEMWRNFRIMVLANLLAGFDTPLQSLSLATTASLATIDERAWNGLIALSIGKQWLSYANPSLLTHE
jgi:hypothetical protein